MPKCRSFSWCHVWHKNKSLAKKKTSSAPKQFSAVASFPYNKFSGFFRFSQPSRVTFRMVLCTVAGMASPGTVPHQDSVCPDAQLNPDRLCGQRTSLKPHPIPGFAREESSAGTSSSGFQGYRATYSRTGLPLLLCQYKSKSSHFLRRFNQFPLVKHPIKYLNP